MLYATGDTHGDFQRFQKEVFPEQGSMGKGDYVLICGDFGGVRDNSEQQQNIIPKGS